MVVAKGGKEKQRDRKGTGRVKEGGKRSSETFSHVVKHDTTKDQDQARERLDRTRTEVVPHSWRFKGTSFLCRFRVLGLK